GLVRCNQMLNCLQAGGELVDSAPIRALIERNDLQRVNNSPLLALMPGRLYPVDRANMLLGRYLTHLPRGQGVVAALKADNALGPARVLRLLAWDCTGRYGQRIEQETVMPAGQADYGVGFLVPQLFEDQCLRIQAIPPPEGIGGDSGAQWRLEGLSLRVNDAIERGVASVRESRSEIISGPIETIAHAGGGIDGKTYSNSIAALDRNLAAGFRWFELDFQWTADGELVCGHDWGATMQRNYGLSFDGPPTRAEFDRVMKGRSDLPCTIETLRQWLDRHSEARIVTDFKARALDGLRVLSKQIPDYGERLIAQVYQPEEFEQARALGYRDIIWTLYQYPGQTQAVLDALTGIRPMAVTMDQQRLAHGLGLRLQRAGVPVYVHTINEAETATEYLQNWGAQGVYTDTLTPADMRRMLVSF
ncbi:MAG: hypothetical protein WBG92_22665, partial [Thiohalocapsa sp.]